MTYRIQQEGLQKAGPTRRRAGCACYTTEEELERLIEGVRKGCGWSRLLEPPAYIAQLIAGECYLNVSAF
jgi:hypothetical protein